MVEGDDKVEPGTSYREFLACYSGWPMGVILISPLMSLLLLSIAVTPCGELANLSEDS